MESTTEMLPLRTLVKSLKDTPLCFFNSGISLPGHRFAALLMLDNIEALLADLHLRRTIVQFFLSALVDHT